MVLGGFRSFLSCISIYRERIVQDVPPSNEGVSLGMVFVSICEHASSAFIFASTNSDQFSHASSEHFVNFPPAGISLF